LPEQSLLSPELERFLCYGARADVLLATADGSRRIWIEFEVSRADPVANHAKFATSHLFQPQGATDTFLAMVSSHVTRGRRNLAASAIVLMRCVGMRAFQTVLFPFLSPHEIQRLNHLDIEAMETQQLSVGAEVERAITVTEAALSVNDLDIHLVGDFMEVLLNLRRWNADLSTPEGQRLWGKRTVTYFVYDADSRLFAPSKFCAYAALPTALAAPSGLGDARLSTMTVEKYAATNDGTHTLDGGRAQAHLTRRLGMLATPVAQAGEVETDFNAWLRTHQESILPHADGAVILLPPAWFR
jgi:hypothetical protein